MGDREREPGKGSLPIVGAKGPPVDDAPPDLAEVRRRLASESGPRYWRSLEEVAQTPAFQSWLEREFPQGASELVGAVSRRRFLQLAGASMALAGLTGCTRQPLRNIIPYVRQPEELVPGRPLRFATAATQNGYAAGLLVTSHEGRPTKVEGNPEHPASLGAADVWSQASILGLYDPDRSRSLRHLGSIRSWESFHRELERALEMQRPVDGAGLRILTETVTSPSLAAQIREVLADLPEARWVQYDPIGPHGTRLGARRAFGEWREVRYDLSRADVILTLESDFLTEGPGNVRYARDFAARRRVMEGNGNGRPSMSRLYSVESSPTKTASQADHRLPLPPEELLVFLKALAAELGVGGAGDAGEGLRERARRWLEPLARDLERARGRSLVVAGPSLPPAAHVLVHALNERLGNLGETVHLTEPVEAEPRDQLADLRELADEMRRGEISLLVILGGNPVYDAPADLDLAGAMGRVGLRIRHGLYFDETSELCHWQVPAAHPLESWGDARAFDGTVTLSQPLIEPLYGGRSAAEVVALLQGERDPQPLEMLRGYWRQRLEAADFDAAWRRSVHDGLIAGTAFAPLPAAVRPDAVAEAMAELPGSVPQRGDGLALLFRPDPNVLDGRYANNGWLQELPRPWTKLTWDNAVLVAPRTAQEAGLRNGDVVRLRHGEAAAEAAVWVLPGHADGCATVHLGLGRTRSGRVGTGVGFDAGRLRTAEAFLAPPTATIERTPRRERLASTQDHHSMEGRHLVRAGTLEQYERNPTFAQDLVETPVHSMYPDWEYPGYAWGMAIDLNACTGCNACVIACQSENNIPVVGKDQVMVGREMHWIRIDRYFEGDDLDSPAVYHQPIVCMHCEKAPCEPVCPVAATVHSDEGLNDMVYNRCVGTRYCSNNCPYKVRRFNFLLYSDFETPTLKLGRNPNVTVRSRGIMEKCTYCVQRINAARIDSKREGRKIRDGEIQTACQQTCPTQAIVFGDINDPDSEVSRWKAQPRDYGLLEELNTRPRTTYLARIRNPNPELEAAEA